MLVVLLLVGCWPRVLVDVIRPGAKQIAAIFENQTGVTSTGVVAPVPGRLGLVHATHQPPGTAATTPAETTAGATK